MCSAFRRDNIIYKRICGFIVGIVVLHRNLNRYTIFYTLTIDNFIVNSFFMTVDVFYKLLNTTLIMEGAFFFFARTLVC